MKINSLGKLGSKLLNSIIFSAFLIIIVVIGLTFSIRLALDANIKGQRILDNIEVSSNQVFRAIIDQETGQRGYSLTKDEEFLEPYYLGQEQFSESSVELLKHTENFKSLHIEALDIVQIGEYWQSTYAEPLVDQARNGEVPNIKSLDDAKHVTDDFRSISFEFSKSIEKERTVVRNTMQTRINSTLITLVVAIIIIILINLWINFKILKSLIKPIIRLSNCVKSYTEHNFSRKVPKYNKQDELFELIQNVDIMRTELSSSIQSLEAKVNIDGLTGLYNRGYFNELMVQVWEDARKKAEPLSMIILDIDYYKNYNDTYGHLKGDECLKIISHKLKDFNHEPFSYVARFGGEEFVVLLRKQGDFEPEKVAEDIRKAILNLQIPHRSSATCEYVTVSVGVATIVPTEDTKPTDIYTMADQALYESKNNGRNQVTSYENMKKYQTT
ncbi:diguanylate cyclase (GGDEF)-like protein [Ureibacillus xyleni]|uniref:Diguanylate cyclase (GGDEF)-like protein n=1 Tax=Ureibacillus xyleni TaxID=614648 RepID=A0A285SD84_9BACL|nr:diguanylate cyclase [Ureibacillus xyleni]SOC05745.1 diguanylate cyclase (GGDEF)-like protein [Ureibacillus xyleni]